MKNFKKIITGLLTCTALACTSDFEEINTNPVAPVSVQPEFLLRQILYDFTDQMSYEGFVAGNLLGQHFTAIDFNLFDRHSLTEAQYGGNPWVFLYRNLRDNEILLNLANENPAYEVYKGPALIYKSYLTSVLTDLYGDVPYSEALKGKAGNVTPKYDDQRNIYLSKGGILDNIDAGIAAINAYKGAIKLNGDIIYNGDLSKWVKLANSLKFKSLMRISAKENVAAQLQTLATQGNLITKAADNAFYSFPAGPPNNFKMATARIGDFNLFIMSATSQEILEKYNDPRKAVFFRPTANNATVYKGLLNGPDASKLSISTADYSFSGRIFREDASELKANFFASFEMNFLLAEAAEKGLISGDAKAYYEAGVKDAFGYWNTPLPADYLSAGAAAYKANGANAIEQIITQKWISNYIHGYESWIEYRRTGFPVLKQIAASLNQNLIPLRLPYPTTEDVLNNANFKIAATATNNNSVNTPVWWDK